MMNIIKFTESYRDDLIFMILEAKNALGRIPGLNSDLLDIKANYFDKGDCFWIAIDENNRVIGSIGYSTNADKAEVTLHRLFVKCNLKRQGIGSRLLHVAEEYLSSYDCNVIYVNLGQGDEWYESRYFYAKHGYSEYLPNKLKKTLRFHRL